ncbi:MULTISPECIES: hypothetical protein [Rhizobiaceae]|jgi:hypothetical protein|uniref:Class I SAM-dependent methyltransferase n=1 Tax=Aliirhizobium cellulosilyticum TaxID=393664 RepID=A0A7W6Y450_9HYPH|nr:hypothetical protein [Rhizobium cellulosilyticum]MBB4348557.1 hypothetical protein [Rhizobium cellulosilyticum]MBB4411793.1 hypothetical protein [Rhizobium cellulosilyticum]MBB4446484.1 hypothetical protein [Rhizobium cellulosilyticum]
MILEAIQYTATALVTPRKFRPFIRSSLGLWGRAARCTKDWAAHEENCHAFIRETIAPMKQRRTAVVLGSGLLRDVPIVELSKRFDTVVLVDLVHLASVRTWIRAKRLTNVRLISRDLSGLEDALSGKTPEPLAFLRQVPYLDLVVSANIVSQIGVGCRRLLERSGHENPDAVISQLIRAHLDGLGQLPCKTALLTDISYEVTDRDGAILEEDDLLCGVAAPEAKRRWNWPVAPFGEIGRDRQAIHRVIAV